MIVINKENGIRGLPYEVEKYTDEKGKDRIRSETFDFLPGNNEISPEIWNKIREGLTDEENNEISPEIWNKIREGLTDEEKAHYDTFLVVIQPTTDESGFTIGPDEKEIDILELNVNEATDFIKGTMDIDTLENYLKIEKKRKDIKPRKMVLKAIEEQIGEIQEFEKKRQEEKDKADNA